MELTFFINFLTKDFEREFSSDEILRGIGLDCNGRWIFPTFSFLTYSCVSNSRFFVHPGDMVVVRAQTDVKAGMEVTISYPDPFSGNVVIAILSETSGTSFAAVRDARM